MFIQLALLSLVALAPTTPKGDELDEGDRVDGGSLKVLFSFKRQVSPPSAPPSLGVRMENRSDKPVSFMRFKSAACFAHFYLQLVLHTPKGKAQAPTAPCLASPWPGSKGTLKPGDSETFELPLRELFPALRWSTGLHGVSVLWSTSNLEKAGHQRFAVRASESSSTLLDNSSLEDLGAMVVPFILAPLQATFRIKTHQTVSMPDGARISFSSHGHKDIRPGQTSPLMVHATFAAPGDKAMEDYPLSLFPETSPQFNLGSDESYLFELVDYEYGRWMVLRYFGRIKGFLR